MADEGLSDFSNDLATDLGPLLVLFGEAMTKQYLSESTAWLDYLIFSVAPIGLLTTVVSAIRVCGHPSLRAFVGRSQEGAATIEAELCTSTSRDVCELFHNGGITRVLGRPHILELVLVEPPADLAKEGRPEVHLFKDHLHQSEGDGHRVAWKAASSSSRAGRGQRARFAPKPNLSLNVGIKKQPAWLFRTVALLGVVLQLGLVALASAGGWFLDWNLNAGPGASPSSNYAPVMFVAGTVLMCFGMGSCAALIGQSTHESRYERTADARTRLLWLQPGSQIVGDQTFDAFAYFDDEENPIREWTSSVRRPNKDFETYAVVAVLTTLVGYVAQFIGLRGMKAWVSLAQLCCTVLMSVLRGCLRMRRLGENDNRLAHIPELVVGHELDWLALELTQQGSKKDLVVDEIKKGGSISEASQIGQPRLYSEKMKTVSIDDGQMDRRMNHQVLQARQRLAHFTGTTSLTLMPTSETQSWPDNVVNARDQARRLSAAICQAARALQDKGLLRDASIELEFGSMVASPSSVDAKMRPYLVKLVPDSGMGLGSAVWKTDAAKMEAILGLTLWLMISDLRLLEGSDEAASEMKASRAHDIGRIRITSIAPSASDPQSRAFYAVNGMYFWLGEYAVQPIRGVFRTGDVAGRNSANLMAVAQDGKSWRRATRGDRNPQMRWVYGQSTLLQQLGSLRLSGEEIEAYFVPRDRPLVDLCAEELYFSLAASLFAKTAPVTPVLKEVNGGALRFEHPFVTILAGAFADHGLGTHRDAVTGVVSAVSHSLDLRHLLTPEDVIKTLSHQAGAGAQGFSWARAAEFLRSAYASHFPGLDDGGTHVKVLCGIGEISRELMARGAADREKLRLGGEGLEHMRTLDRERGGTSDGGAVIERYGKIKEYLELPGRQGAKAKGYVDKVVGAIRTDDRTEALRLLSVPPAQGVDFDAQLVLHLAVGKGWDEVARLLLKLGADPDAQDTDKKPAAFYSLREGLDHCTEVLVSRGAVVGTPFNPAWDDDTTVESGGAVDVFMYVICRGLTSVIRPLIEGSGVDPNERYGGRRTLLSWAAQKRQPGIVRALLDKGGDAALADDDGRTPLSWAAEYGCVDAARMLSDPDAVAKPDGQEQTPLFWAARYGHEAVVRHLLEKGAVHGFRDADGRTPLSWAAARGHAGCVRALLEFEADRHAVDDKGRSPMWWAKRNDHAETIMALQDL